MTDFRSLTEESIRRMNNPELDALLQKLRDEGVLPKNVKGNPAHIRRLYAAQLAQIIQSAADQRIRRRDEDALLLLLFFT